MWRQTNVNEITACPFQNSIYLCEVQLILGVLESGKLITTITAEITPFEPEQDNTCEWERSETLTFRMCFLSEQKGV